MLGELTADRIEHMLHLEVLGRLGCHAFGRTYVVPITYAYDGKAIYAYSFEGLKLRMMRANPDVCFEVDRFDMRSSWESIVVQGRFEELAGEEAETARALLLNRFRRLRMYWATVPPPSREKGSERRGSEVPVVFRIVPVEKTGRFERADDSG
jgi:uncharacterized protein